MKMTKLLLGALCAVSFSTASFAQDDRFKAVTTFTVIADMAQNVAGDAAIVESITKAGAEIHGYQPTPRDIIRAQDADLIRASKGPTPPEDNCSKATDKKRAAKEMIIRMD